MKHLLRPASQEDIETRESDLVLYDGEYHITLLILMEETLDKIKDTIQKQMDKDSSLVLVTY